LRQIDRRCTDARCRKEAHKFEAAGHQARQLAGELLGSCSVNFGQVVQSGPPPQAVEFTYIIVPAALSIEDVQFIWPSVIMIMTPTPMKTEFPDAGVLFKVDHSPCLSLSLEVTRHQFSDMLRMLEGKRLKSFHFTTVDETDGSWPIHSWGMTTTIG